MSDTQVYDPSTGSTLTLPADEAQKRYVEGRAQLIKGAPVRLYDPSTNEVLDTDPAKVDVALRSGQRFATKDELLRQRAEGEGGRAYAEGLAKELTLGGSDAALKALGVEGLKQRRETTAGQAGEWSGVAASLVGPGMLARGAAAGVERGALGQLAEAALSPAAKLSELNAAVTAGAEKVLGNVITNKTVSKALASGLGTATESAVYGAGNALSEESLGDAPTNAGHLLAAAGVGGLVGFAAGGGLRGLAEKRAGRAALELSPDEMRLAAEASSGADMAGSAAGFDKWGKRVQMALRRGVANVAEGVAGVKAEEQLLWQTPAGRRVIREGEDALDREGRAFVDAANGLIEHEKAIVADSFKAKAAQADALLPKGAENNVLRAADEQLSRIDAKHAELIEAAPSFGLRAEQMDARLGSERELLERIKDRAFKVAGVDRHRRELSELADILPPERARKVALHLHDELNKAKQLYSDPARFGDEVSNVGDRRIRDEYQDIYKGLMAHLEDESVYGALGRVHGEVNAAYKNRIGAQERLFKALGVKNMEEGVSSGKVAAYVKQVNRMRGDPVVDAMDDYTAHVGDYAKLMDEHFGTSFTPSAERAIKLFSASRKGLEDNAVVLNSLLRAENKERRMWGGALGGGAVLGGILGGPVGAAVGGVGGVAAARLFRPAQALRIEASVAGMLENVGRWVRGRTGALVGAPDAGVVPTFEMARVVSRATTRMLGAKTPEERREAFDDRLSEIRSLSEPGNFAANASQNLFGVAEHMPNHAAAFSVAGLRTLGVIRDSIPTSPTPSAPMDMFEPPQLRDSEIRKWAEDDKLLQDPAHLLDLADKHQLTARHVALFEKAHPELLESIRTATLDGLAALGKRPPRAKLRVLSVLLGQPLAPGQSARRIASWQAAHGPQDMSQGVNAVPPPRKPPVASRIRARSASISSISDSHEGWPSQG